MTKSRFLTKSLLRLLVVASLSCFDASFAWQPHLAKRFGSRHVVVSDSNTNLPNEQVTSSMRQPSIDTSDKRLDAEHTFKTLTRGVTCATLAIAGFLWVPTPTTCSPAFLAHPPPAIAMDLPTTSHTTTVSTSSLSSQALTWSLALAENTEQPDENPPTVLDEAWTLINKYYIDRSFAGQDWFMVKRKYTQALQRQPTEEMRLITDMVQSLQDKYSRVLSAEQYAAIQKYDLIGVGATLMPNADKEIMVGAPPIPGSAAAVAGLQVGDIVQAVNGQSTQGRTAFDIIDQIAQDDPNANTITLTIRKVGALPADATDYTLARAFQKVKNPIQYKITETRNDGTKVGFVRINEFNALVKPSLEAALSDLQQQGANAFVLDLRGNGGGAFQSAVEISSLFMNQQIATYVVDGTTAEIPFTSAKNRVMVDTNAVPLVIWMDGRTASASEVLAAALHDNCRAVLAGQPSFGKGLIQAVYGLKNGSGLVLTVAKYVTPKHDEIQGVGLQPDVAGMVPGTLIPGLYTADTSSVDFSATRKQLSMCAGPSSKSGENTMTTTTSP